MDKHLTLYCVSGADGDVLPVNRTRTIGRGNLEITDVTRQDAGLYHCALAGFPDVFAEAMLTVIGEFVPSQIHHTSLFIVHRT